MGAHIWGHNRNRHTLRLKFIPTLSRNLLKNIRAKYSERAALLGGTGGNTNHLRRFLCSLIHKTEGHHFPESIKDATQSNYHRALSY